MKKLFFALIMCTAALAAFAQDPSTSATPAPATQENPSPEMQPIAASDLPAAITASLEGQDYSGWTVSKAFKKEKDGKTVYKVELMKGTETKTVKFDADGNKLKAKDKDKDKAVQ